MRTLSPAPGSCTPQVRPCGLDCMVEDRASRIADVGGSGRMCTAVRTVESR
jgi:hypothetical protein